MQEQKLRWYLYLVKAFTVSYIASNPHTHTVLMAILPGEPGLAGCPLNSPSLFIPAL